MRVPSMLQQSGCIPYGTLLKIMWLDACTVRDAALSKLPLPNYYVETRRSTVGSFVTLQKGQSQNAHHLVLEMDRTEGSGSMIRSIPSCLIYHIDVASKRAETVERTVGGGQKLLVRERFARTLKDGSVKLFD